MKRTVKKGFTIVELVIVIAVVAILAAVLIPTFASLIKKANMSVDMQIVRQMNTILQADEAVAGKPATVVQVRQILADNGCDDFTPTFEQNVYYWVGAENRVILWEKDEPVSASAMMMVVSADDGAETGKVTYPEDMAKKYKDVTEPSADWADLDAEYVAQEVVPAEGQSLKDALIVAIENAPDGAILSLPANSELQMAQGGLHWLGESLRMDGGVGKHITLDLNNSTLLSSGSNARFTKTKDGSGWLIDDEGDYVMNVLTVPENGELVLANGKLEIQHGNQPALASVMALSGAKLVMRDIEMNTSAAGVMPAGNASEVVLEDCIINASNYALGTNRMESNNIRIMITNSQLSVTHSTAMLINCASDTHIYNSTITGVVHAIALRAGTLELKDSTLITTDTEPGIYAYKAFAQGYNFAGWWGTGNTIPGGVLVAGDYAKANGDGSFSYSGDAVVTISNTKLQSANPAEIPEILLAASDAAKKVTITHDDASAVGTPAVYGSVWTSSEAVTFNHPGTMTVNGVAKTLG